MTRDGLPRVLFIAPCLPPIAVAESIATLKRLRMLAGSLELTVVGADDPSSAFPMPPDRSLEAFLPASLRLVRVRWPDPRRWAWATTSGRLLLTHSALADVAALAWARDVRRAIHRQGLLDGVTALITNSSPVISHLIGHRLKRRAPGLIWVQHYSDPLVDSVYRRYHPLSRWLDMRFERRFLAAADLVTVTSPETRELLVVRYAQTLPDLESRVVVVPHTYDAEVFSAASGHPPSTRFGPGRLHLTHLGHFYGRRSIAPLCRWLDWRSSQVPALAKVCIHLFGSLRARERDLARRRYRDAIEIHRPVAYLESLALMRQSDALVVVDAPADGPSVHFPSKLADYLGAGRPVVAFTPHEGATARIVAETGNLAVPVSAGPEDFARIEARLARLSDPTAPARQYASDPALMTPLVEAIRRRRT